MKPHISTEPDGTLVVRFVGARQTPDKLIPYPFVEIGLTERNAARELASRVPVVRLGRKRYAKCSDLMLAIDALAREQAEERAQPKATPEDAGEIYLRLVGGQK